VDAWRSEDGQPLLAMTVTDPARKPAVSLDPEAPHVSLCDGDSDHVATISETTHAFNPNVMALRGGRAVVRSPGQLRLHPALEKLGWTCRVDELNDATRLKELSIPGPILITNTGVILAGFGSWRFEVLKGSRQIDCVEYLLDEHESLQFIVAHHHTRQFFNAFVRISLALTLKDYFHKKALENMSSGGKLKGLAKLPNAERLDVRKELADIAGVGPRNVANVVTIWETAHPRLIEALIAGDLTINGAMQFCKWPMSEQVEQFTQHCEDRETDKVIRRAVLRSENENTSLDTTTVLEALQQQEKRQPGSVVIRIGRLPHTVILIGRDSLTTQISQGKLNLA
jgi:hypothetical protein